MSDAAHNNDKQFLMYQLKWMGIYVGIGFAISLVLPFPISLVGALGAFLLLNFIRTRRMLKKSGIDMKGLFRSLSSASSSSVYGYNPLKYYCMSCGKEHKEIACPNCGSKMKRVG
jgi:Na+/H+ antiporter NhaD/arsenite permease-like protein